MNKRPTYHYRDLGFDGKPDKWHWTRGQFAGWIRDGLGIRRAVFCTKTQELFVSEYCLRADTRELLREIAP